MKESRPLTTQLFRDKDEAERAYQTALDHGYTDEDISVLMSADTRKKHYTSPLVTGDKSMEGLAIGGALGGTIGGTLGAIAAIGTAVAFPGLGLIVAGPIVMGLAGAGAGSISGGVLGALIGAGIPEARAKVYEKELKNGAIVLAVQEREDLDSLQDKWKNKETTTF